MDREKRIIAFIRLGKELRKGNGALPENIIAQASARNPWFTSSNIDSAIKALGGMMEEKNLREWLSSYPDPTKKIRVNVIMAGNIPLVGFHDFLCVLISGHSITCKLAADDELLLPAVAQLLIRIEPDFKNRISFQSAPLRAPKDLAGEPLAFIATGSNNTARHFEYYFRNHPHIIRGHRNAVAVLDGKESAEELKQLGDDIFLYFGLGCRNVSKIYVPADFNLDRLFAALVDHGDIIHHHKYANNYQYNRTVYLLNKDHFLDNNFLLVKESSAIASPVATLHFERYSDLKKLSDELISRSGDIQCIAARTGIDLPNTDCIPLGSAQHPGLQDYADGVDTMNFLERIKNN